MRTDLHVTLPAIIGHVLKEIRSEKKISQKYVADKLEISVSGLSKIENGVTALSVEQLFLFSNIYEISTLEIISKIETLVAKLNQSEIAVINSKLNSTKGISKDNLKSNWWLAFIEQ